MRLVLVGPPGSGKSTQAQQLAGHLGVPVVSAGELLRSRAGSGNGVWREVAAHLERGELVPDDLVVDVVGHALEAAATSGGYVLEGFPRTLAQARHRSTPALDLVVHLALPDDVARLRLAHRAAGGRPDDTDPEVVERRLRRYHADTEPVLEFYRAQGTLGTVDASQSPEAVTAAILRAVSEIQAGG
jgi:adenylate kinase